MHNSQMIALTIKNYAKLKNIKTGDMLAFCQLGKNTLSAMQSGGNMPSAEKICKIADYLDCSVDYLFGRTDKPEINK